MPGAPLPSRRPRPIALELGLLALLATSPWLPSWAGPGAALAAAVLWFVRADAPRERRLVGALFVLAAASLAIGTAFDRSGDGRASPSPASWQSGFRSWLG
ncbi:MAG TPA: hypothetical protein VLA66_02835, partial [Thermoanaerobaculia bacterium]|nr:hypothetical protein [Thermoanaerobaculia bacterium]